MLLSDLIAFGFEVLYKTRIHVFDLIVFVVFFNRLAKRHKGFAVVVIERWTEKIGKFFFALCACTIGTGHGIALTRLCAAPIKYRLTSLNCILEKTQVILCSLFCQATLYQRINECSST